MTIHTMLNFVELDTLIKAHGFSRVYMLAASSLGEEWERFYAGRPDYGLVLDSAGAFPWASSVLLLVRAYTPFRASLGMPSYYIASNAGYHAAKELAAQLNALGVKAHTFAPPYKALAIQNRLGVQRKNGLIDIPGFGTRVVFYAIAIDANITQGFDAGDNTSSTQFYELPEPCSSCEICAKACPANAIDACHGLDYRKCIRNFMVSGDMPDWVKAKLPGLLGCELCQAVCPRNAFIGVREPTQEEMRAFDLHRLARGEIAEARILAGKNMCSNGRLQAQARELLARRS